MTLMSSKYSCQKKYYEAIFFRIPAIVRKTLWDIRLVSGITESRKLKNLASFRFFKLFLDSVIMHFLTLYPNILFCTIGYTKKNGFEVFFLTGIF
jgi:hypothetical protein